MQKLGHKVVFLEQVGSTNTYVQNLASEKKLHGMVFYTYDQTAGRGQRTRTWEMSPNQNVAMSVLLQESLPTPENQYILNAWCALAVARTVRHFVQKETFIKWPNDIIVADRKISGILIENSVLGDKLRESVVGIGLNINQLTWNSFSTATSLALETGNTYSLNQVRLRLLEDLNEEYHTILRETPTKLWSRYNSLLYKGGELQDLEGNVHIPIEVLPSGGLWAQNEQGVGIEFQHGNTLWSLER